MHFYYDLMYCTICLRKMIASILVLFPKELTKVFYFVLLLKDKTLSL